MRFNLKNLLILFFFLTIICNAEDNAYSVGIIAPLTGNQAQIGYAIQNGIKLAKKENPSLLKNINFIIEDSQFNNKTAINAFKKLTTVNKTKLVYVFGHGQSHTLSSLAKNSKVLLIACTGEKDIELNNNYIIRFFVPHELFGYTLLKKLRSEGYKNLGIIKTELSFIENIFKGLKINLEEGENLEVIESHSFNENDFKTTIIKAKKGNYDSLGVFLGQGQIAPFYQQLKQFNFKISTFGTHAFESSEEIKQSGDLINGAIIPAITSTKEFNTNYKKTFGNLTFVAFAANVYDFTLLVGKYKEFINKPLKIIKYFKKNPPINGASGKFYYEESSKFGSGFTFPIALKQIRNNKLVVISNPKK